MICQTCGNKLIKVEYSRPDFKRIIILCPICIEIVGVGNGSGKGNLRTKSTIIPDGERYFPDEDDDNLARMCDREVKDEITEVGIDYFLGGENGN